MGVGGERYLASPAVVAASALVGYMGPPEEPRSAMGAGALREHSRVEGSAPMSNGRIHHIDGMLGHMGLVKIRRQGRSLAVTLSSETLREARLREGDLVQPTVENGRVVLVPVSLAPGVRPEVMEAIERAVAENNAVLQRLADYDTE